MKTRLLGAVYALSFSLIPIMASNAQAALVQNAVLNFDAGVPDEIEEVVPLGGSYFSLQLSPPWRVHTTIAQLNGIRLGKIQSASGSHTGHPVGSESPNIDQPWVMAYFGNTGMHETAAPITILSDDNNGNVTLDFSGWGMEWNDSPFSDVDPFISLGGHPLFIFDTGVATMTCGSTCEIGDSYSLDYMAHVYDIPGNRPSGLDRVEYRLHLEGTIGTVPIPAAVWLFGSGLLGLIGVARKKAA